MLQHEYLHIQIHDTKLATSNSTFKIYWQAMFDPFYKLQVEQVDSSSSE